MLKGLSTRRLNTTALVGGPRLCTPAALCGHSGLKIARRQREHKKLGEESEEHGNSWREGVGVDLN